MSVSDFMILNSELGIDLDEPTELQFLITYFNTKHLFRNSNIEVYKSSGGSGYHISIKNTLSKLSIRRTLGDCKDRMFYSELRSKTNQNKDEFVFGDPTVDDVLFSIKTKKVNHKYTRSKQKRLLITSRQKRVKLDERTIIARRFW